MSNTYQSNSTYDDDPAEAQLSSYSLILNGGGNGISGSRSGALQFDLSQRSNFIGIDNLLFRTSTIGTKWGSALNQGVNLTFSFSGANSTYAAGFTPGSQLNLTATQINTARQAMQVYSNISGLTFTEVADTATSAGDIRWGRSANTSDVKTAYARYPSNTGQAGDIWLGMTYDYEYQNPKLGSYGYQTYLHELGHALGLTHPHESCVPAAAGEDQLKYSVMSYKDYAGTPWGSYTTHYFPTSLMLNDIAAIQYLYGVNTGYQSGNNTYSWAADTSIYETIYDGGGIDTIDASNQTLGVLLNLNSGSWSQIGKAFQNGQGYVRDCLTIAYSSTIENATGSAYNDTLIGNAVANVLNGGAGADTMQGNGGDDTYYVDNIGDVVIENTNEGIDTVYTGLTSYTLGSNIENLTLTGTARCATGNNLDNKIIGNSQHNDLYGGYGKDTLIGLSGNDSYWVDNSGDVVIENINEGIDTVFSEISYTLPDNVENLTLTSHINATLTGNSLNNEISGGSVSGCTIQGGAGADILKGYGGSDIYIFNRGDGADLIQELSSSDPAAKSDVDILKFGQNINSNQIWFSKQPENGALTVGIIGTTDKVSIESWYSNQQTNLSGCYIEKIQSGDGKTLTYDKVDQLVNAMAAFAPPALGQTTLPSNYQQALSSVISAAWI